MARTTYAKAQKLSKREQDKVQALKADYLQTVYTKKQRLGVWKKWEFFRLLFIWAAWLTLIAGVVTGILRWARATVSGDLGVDRFFYFNLGGGTELYIHKVTVHWIVAGLAAFVVCGIIALILSPVCKAKYKKYSTKADHVDIKLDNLKREKIDSVLENQIVVSVRSIFETLVEYEDVLEGEAEDDDEYEYFDANKAGTPELRTFTGSVDSAVVYIDGMEVGAVDLDSEFSCFRVEPGLHTLKIAIKKEFPYYGKQLVIETPTNPIRVDGDYRIVLYSLLTKQNKGVIRYKLKVAEYDDMVIFMRDTRQAGNPDDVRNADKMSKYLKKRATKLHLKLFGLPETEEQYRLRESALYGEETANMEALSRNMDSTFHDARLNRANKIGVTLNQPMDIKR
jgi:hypothetical protein